MWNETLVRQLAGTGVVFFLGRSYGRFFTDEPVLPFGAGRIALLYAEQDRVMLRAYGFGESPDGKVVAGDAGPTSPVKILQVWPPAAERHLRTRNSGLFHDIVEFHARQWVQQVSTGVVPVGLDGVKTPRFLSAVSVMDVRGAVASAALDRDVEEIEQTGRVATAVAPLGGVISWQPDLRAVAASPDVSEELLDMFGAATITAPDGRRASLLMPLQTEWRVSEGDTVEAGQLLGLVRQGVPRPAIANMAWRAMLAEQPDVRPGMRLIPLDYVGGMPITTLVEDYSALVGGKIPNPAFGRTESGDAARLCVLRAPACSRLFRAADVEYAIAHAPTRPEVLTLSTVSRTTLVRAAELDDFFYARGLIRLELAFTPRSWTESSRVCLDRAPVAAVPEQAVPSEAAVLEAARALLRARGIDPEVLDAPPVAATPMRVSQALRS